MASSNIGPELQRMIDLLAKLPGLGPRSAKRAALHLLNRRDPLMRPLAYAIAEAADKVQACATCGNLDSINPCAVCADPARDRSVICIVESVGDLWAMERAGAHRGTYHVLGGLLSPLDGVGPDDLKIGKLVARASEEGVTEVILALATTVDGQTTAHYVADQLLGKDVSITQLSQGVPVGGELDYLDEGTIAAAMRSRRPT
ncbi:MAG: recombination protein RecR [Alphaproteobacteria bacterium]|nr:recombination protein RecR [Alphaproteobacteria bacterium]